MIFVTVGMHPDGFERLITAMDKIAGECEEEIVMQIGHTKYVPRNADYFDFCSEQRIKELCRRARVVVTHGGVGTILDVLQERVPLVVIPRLKKYGEHIDDHQVFLVQELEKQGKVTAVYDIEKLAQQLEKVDLQMPQLEKDTRLVNALKRTIAQFEHH